MLNTKLVRLQTNPLPGYIYLISAVGTNKFKIGKTVAGVIERLKNLQTGSPLKLRYVYHAYVANVNFYEMELHQIFRNKREIGEWFGLTSDDVKECILLMRLVQEVEPESLPIEIITILEVEAEPEAETEAEKSPIKFDPYLNAIEQQSKALNKLLKLLSHGRKEVEQLIPIEPDKALWLGIKTLKMRVTPASQHIFDCGTGGSKFQKAQGWYKNLEGKFGKIVE